MPSAGLSIIVVAVKKRNKKRPLMDFILVERQTISKINM